MHNQMANNLYRILVSSLYNHLYGVTCSHKHGRKCVFTPTEEQLVVNWICKFQNLSHPMIMATLGVKVVEILEGREMSFIEGIPGRDWQQWYRHRHPELALRGAQGLQISRAWGLCEENLQSFYANLRQLYDSNLYSPNRIWNYDETGARLAGMEVHFFLHVGVFALFIR